MHTITFTELKKFSEWQARCPLNTDLFWGTKQVVVNPPKLERVYFNMFKDLARKSPKRKAHKKDNGNTLTPGHVTRLVHHFQKVGKFPLGVIKVIPG